MHLEPKAISIFKRRNPMGSKLYVGGLPYSATQDELTDLFSAHGTVESANIISDKFTGQSRGFGFVEMSSDEEAKAAIDALNSTEFGGRTLTVNEARPQAPRTGGGGGGRGGFGGSGGGGGFGDKRRSRF
jgi:RNA recognition motif-containing protein